jgi:multiple sugar transport system substrate-binding protein
VISPMLFAGGYSGGSSETVSESSDGKVVLDYWHTYSDQEEVLNEKI